MKTIIVLITIFITVLFLDIVNAQVTIEYPSRHTRFTMRLDSITPIDTTNAIPVIHSAHRAAVYVQFDTVRPNKGTIPAMRVFLQFADSAGLWANKLVKGWLTSASFSQDTLIDTIAIGSRYQVDFTDRMVPSSFMRLIFKAIESDAKDTVYVKANVIQD